MDTATQSQSGWNSKGSQRKNGQRPSNILLIRLLKRFFNDLLFQSHLRMVKLKPFWKPSNSTLQVLLSSNLNFCTTYIQLCKSLRRRWRDRKKWLLPLNFNTTTLKSKMLSSSTRIDLSLSICYSISDIPKFHMDYNFHRGIC